MNAEVKYADGTRVRVLRGLLTHYEGVVGYALPIKLNGSKTWIYRVHFASVDSRLVWHHNLTESVTWESE